MQVPLEQLWMHLRSPLRNEVVQRLTLMVAQRLALPEEREANNE